jgi:UPF0755 protein
MYYLNLGVTTSKVLYVPQGSIAKIITYLQHKKLDVSPMDSFLLRFIGMPQQGWINMGSEKLTHADFLIKLTRAKAAMQDVTLIPGETTAVFMDEMAKTMGLDTNVLMQNFHSLSPFEEGALVPETYKLPLGITEHDAVKLLLNRSQRQMMAWSEKIFGTYNEHKWLHYVTIASVIQKEAATVEEMPLVSSVIHNRIAKGMKLQMDGTLNYGKYSHEKITPKRIRLDKSRYNTYLYKGLPSAPVCNVSFDAIKAAIFPAKSDYLYFVKNKRGTHDFTRYYSTHINNIRRATK